MESRHRVMAAGRHRHHCRTFREHNDVWNVWRYWRGAILHKKRETQMHRCERPNLATI